MKKLFANRVLNNDTSDLDEIFKNSANPENISFAGGFPDIQLFPDDDLKQAYRDAIDADGQAIFQYASTAGPLALRQKLATRMQTHADVTASADEIMLTQGGQQAIDLVAKLLLNRGDSMVVEGPTYMGALAAFDTYEPTYYEVPVNKNGMDIKVLQQTLQAHPEIKLIYTVPDFHNPTGTTLSAKRRQAMVALANQYDVIILEDSPYRDLRYSGKSIPAIKHYDTEGRVIFISSFSKILSPALRTGWLVADPQLMTELIGLKSAIDVQSPNITLAAINSYLDHHDIDAHIATINQAYRIKRDAMLAALDKYFPKNITYTRPNGGFFIWVTLPQGTDAKTLLTDVVLPQAHVAYVPSACQFASRQVKNAFRLNFTSLDPETITRGIQQLGELLQPSPVQQTTTAAWVPHFN
ncbi:PLP-dependent aminotransferase family protein [Lactiplantibacillus mudanjiangensis]|uniref:Aspartate aminotransferase [Lactobacillus plantarum subsp. plantarum] n=1 Tax=Lactiplantibacillus mudanjiangensis TaxID=1296538 RepID=A0A660DZY9_9LACO|nr:PLP-dependent aminotransferase family protein [Lactiplantibacillus mudanjiangensis]VDG20317.1 aspartate aminotransferase [Lactobacillus plantarum subsp. plantarum] [Lactiplantibacillus mudanjiangensis]VDG23990.1 aspartate aminotransferase [Lactobacillus plantarum subsp. plantarum] [Lactiplantibacillus mudanjiangensis]VDG27218.1 aspartate aminotransferase [Lactobacillus plantarum subsp. plantarum] [Lactiplantibacillus mudanjiangensis]VDG33922.1 aspartate aminotransferase [Lactobacillus planta